MDRHDDAVSVEQFVLRLTRERNMPIPKEDAVLYGYNAGWLEEQDVTCRTKPLERMAVARILHQFMKLECKEADEEDVLSASKLQDLYECRTCVGHVMQVYGKGIMDGHMDSVGRFVFGMHEKVTFEEMDEILRRLFCPDMRTIRKLQKTQTGMSREVQGISFEAVLVYVGNHADACIIDVRPQYEFQENHISGAVNIPFATILKNPYVVNPRRDVGILLYCSEGYQSYAAARCLADAGYEKVFYFAWQM